MPKRLKQSALYTLCVLIACLAVYVGMGGPWIRHCALRGWCAAWGCRDGVALDRALHSQRDCPSKIQPALTLRWPICDLLARGDPDEVPCGDDPDAPRAVNVAALVGDQVPLPPSAVTVDGETLVVTAPPDLQLKVRQILECLRGYKDLSPRELAARERRHVPASQVRRNMEQINQQPGPGDAAAADGPRQCDDFEISSLLSRPKDHETDPVTGEQIRQFLCRRFLPSPSGEPSDVSIEYKSAHIWAFAPAETLQAISTVLEHLEQKSGGSP